MADPLLPHPPGGATPDEPGSDVEVDAGHAAEPADEAELPVGPLPDPPFRTPEAARDEPEG